jgi:hypothetical protein
MECENTERDAEAEEDTVMADPFINEGLSSSSDSDANTAYTLPGTRFHAGKTKWEDLKCHLFRAKEKRRRHCARRQRQELGISSDEE